MPALGAADGARPGLAKRVDLRGAAAAPRAPGRRPPDRGRWPAGPPPGRCASPPASVRGSMTMPSPSTQVTPGRRMPEGMRWVTYFLPPTTRVWPALAPPPQRATTWARLGQQVDDLALAFVPPLRSDDDDDCHVFNLSGSSCGLAAGRSIGTGVCRPASSQSALARRGLQRFYFGELPATGIGQQRLPVSPSCRPPPGGRPGAAPPRHRASSSGPLTSTPPSRAPLRKA